MTVRISNQRDDEVQQLPTQLMATDEESERAGGGRGGRGEQADRATAIMFHARRFSISTSCSSSTTTNLETRRATIIKEAQSHFQLYSCYICSAFKPSLVSSHRGGGG